MPLGTLGAAAASQGLQTGGNIISNWQNRRYAKKAYAQQRKDNLADWHMQNEYNAPVNQRARLEEAGLNPALMYNNSSSPGNASPVQKGDIKPVNHRNVMGDNTSLIQQYYDTKIKQAQVDNLKADNTVKTQDAILKAAQTERTLTDNNIGQFDLQYKNDLRAVSADHAREKLRQTTVQTDNMISSEERKKALHAPNLEQAAISILRGRQGYKLDKQKLKNMTKDLQLKQLEYQLNKEGIQKSDPLWLRALIQRLNALPNFKDLNESLKKKRTLRDFLN